MRNVRLQETIPTRVSRFLGSRLWLWILSLLPTAASFFIQPRKACYNNQHAAALETDFDSSCQLDPVARTMAFAALQSVFDNQVPAEKALQRSLRRLPDQYSTDEQRCLRCQLASLVLGTFIWRRRYEYILNTSNGTTTTTAIGTDVSSTHAGSNSMHHPDQVKTFDDAMIYRMLDLHIASLHESHDDHDIAWPEDDSERLSVQYSLPLFLCQVMLHQYGLDSTQQLCQVTNQPGPITLRRNAVRCLSDDALVQRLQDDHNMTTYRLDNVVLSDNETGNRRLVLQSPPGCLRLTRESRESTRKQQQQPSIWSTLAWQDGWLEIQDIGSQLIVQATDAKLGETIVDYCAGNGGKTLALASLIMMEELSKQDNTRRPKSHIWSHDIVPERLRQLEGSLKRAGLVHHDRVCIHTTTDAATIDAADVVLVDAPCSASGVLRRRPSQRWMMNEQECRFSLPALQLDILRNASRVVKPGGRLVYATCSLLKYENEDVVDAWEAILGDEWEPWGFEQNTWPVLNSYSSRLHCRSLLPHIHDSDGFFIARWKRRV